MNFFKNLELKILAFFSALILWFFVVGIENNSFRFSEPIDIHAINIAADLSATNDLGKGNIRIRADQNMLKNLTKNDFDLFVDVKNKPEGEYDLPLVATSKKDQVFVLKVEPATTHVVLESVTQKDVKVKAVVSGSPAKGYSVGNIQITPSTVTIHGGKSLLNKISSIDAEVKLDGTEIATFNRTISVKNPNQNIVIDQPQVGLVISIAANPLQKTVAVTPHMQGNATVLGNAKLVITPQNIIIQGDDATLKNTSALDTEPLSYEKLKASTIPVKIKIILPPGITLASGQADFITISLTANP